MDPVVFRLRIFLAVMLFITMVGAVSVMRVENLSPLDALYFTVVTITTVGYGDIHPSSPAGKILAMVLIIGGVGCFMGLVANATELLVSRRAKMMREQKQNVVIGVFFAELGTDLLAVCVSLDRHLEAIRPRLLVTGHWKDQDFNQALLDLPTLGLALDLSQADLVGLRDFLGSKSDLILRLLENPSLLEHEAFTDLLRAVFHVRDELAHRHDPTALSPADRAHLTGDLERAYLLLVAQWLPYMRHLKECYPYLFSLAVRLNPFRPGAHAEID
jgi:hypothetical protein